MAWDFPWLFGLQQPVAEHMEPSHDTTWLRREGLRAGNDRSQTRMSFLSDSKSVLICPPDHRLIPNRQSSWAQDRIAACRLKQGKGKIDGRPRLSALPTGRERRGYAGWLPHTTSLGIFSYDRLLGIAPRCIINAFIARRRGTEPLSWVVTHGVMLAAPSRLWGAPS